MRVAALAFLILLSAAFARAVEEDDVLFFAPFEGSTDAPLARGSASARVTGAVQFSEGVRGKALVTDARTLLRYAMKGNCRTEEGTIMMWIKPQWRSGDRSAFHFFRASTGEFHGKALNGLLLYKHFGSDRLMVYTSNGAETPPAQGRTIAALEPAGLEPNRWYHVAATWSSNVANAEMFLYLNGRRVAAAAGMVVLPDRMPEMFDIGGPQGSGMTAFDDVLIFSRPLLAREIAEIYDASRGGKTQPGRLPFLPRADLPLRAAMLFGRGQLLVEADARSARKLLAEGPGRVEVVLEQAGRQMRVEAAISQERLVAKLGFSYQSLQPGPCRLTATLRDASGKSLRTGQLEETIPEKPVWLDNDLGKSLQVLPPWTPPQTNGSAVGVWGRRYEFDQGPLPRAIVSQGRPLLRAPLTLTLQSGGLATSLLMKPVAPMSAEDAAVRASWSGTLGPLACTASSRVECDGFALIDMQLNPANAVAVDALTLTIPLRCETATLYHHADGTWTNRSEAGAVGPADWNKKLPFVPYVWIGDEQGGLAWCCDENRGWHNADPEQAIELHHGADGVDLKLHVVDGRTHLAKPLRLTFGLMATPLKPMPARWRDWRMASMSGTEVTRFAANSEPAPGCRNIVNLWHTNVGAFSYLPADPAEMRGKVTYLHEHGWATVISYFALDRTQTDTPDYRLMEREWRRNPYTETDFAGGSNASVCNASNWADFLVWAVARTLDQTGTDGVYLDCTSPDFCANGDHGCAAGRYPLLATRQLVKRIYAVVKQKRGERGFVYCHISENNMAPIFSFADAVLNGEQYNRKDLHTLDFAKFRAELSPQPYGVPAVLLPTLVKFQPGGREKMPGAEFLAFPLLHDTLCAGSWLSLPSRQLLKTMQSVLHDFGAAEAEFLPYWSHAAEIGVAKGRATVSGYLRRDGRAALLIAQANDASAHVAVTLNGRLAPLRNAAAYDPLGKEMLPWEDGKLLWPLPDRAVHLVLVGTDASRKAVSHHVNH